LQARNSRELEFGTLENGEVVRLIELINQHGMSARIITYGASIQSVCVPDRDGNFDDVTTGYAALDDYLTKPQFFGSTVGRVANRLAKSRFAIGGKDYSVPANDGPNSLHGGTNGFDKVNWAVTQQHGRSVTLQYVSPDGDQGYPGTLTVTATYSVEDKNSLSVLYRATTDAPTVVNLSNHAYWNLGGEGAEYGAMDHLLTIHADRFLPVDAELIPTGEMQDVEDTPFDFRKPRVIGECVGSADDPQIAFGHGYDHNWVISNKVVADARPVAHLEDPRSGRSMTVLSNQPGLQFYSGNFFDGTTSGKSGKTYRRGDAIALEPQQFPNAPNQPGFQLIELNPGQTYSNIIVWRFGTAKKRP
jgi:aldose 1-epimerase